MSERKCEFESRATLSEVADAMQLRWPAGVPCQNIKLTWASTASPNINRGKLGHGGQFNRLQQKINNVHEKPLGV